MSRDFVGHEKKKPKKSLKKSQPLPSLAPRAEVELVRKPRKKKEEVEE